MELHVSEGEHSPSDTPAEAVTETAIEAAVEARLATDAAERTEERCQSLEASVTNLQQMVETLQGTMETMSIQLASLEMRASSIPEVLESAAQENLEATVEVAEVVAEKTVTEILNPEPEEGLTDTDISPTDVPGSEPPEEPAQVRRRLIAERRPDRMGRRWL